VERRFGGGGKMVVELIKDKELWDEFVDKSPYGLLFHKWDFLKIMEKYSDYKLLPYGIYKGETLICICPLFYKKIKGLKMVFSPPPQTGVPYLGFVMNSIYNTSKSRKKEGYLNIVADEINEEIKKISPNYVSISTVPNFLDIRPFKWNGYSVEISYTYAIDLEISLDNIWNNFEKDCRREIRNSDKFSLFLKQTDDINTFYNILKDRYNQQKLNFPFISPEYFKEIITIFPNNIKIYFLYDDSNIIDITANYEYKNRIMFWKGWVNLQKNIHSSEYLTWEFIKEAKSNGYKKVEIQGANVKRLCHFKSKFNPFLEIFFNIYKKDALGKLAEWTYLNFLRKRWF
jgi:lipid II:glycine glycyltransferase (peptidoglycan interpeptide bridge formation enzyme)